MRDDIEPQQRYWRRRANMKVRKRRIARNATRWMGMAAVQIAVGAVVLYGASEGFKKVTRSAVFAFHTIDLRGTQHADDNAILAAIAGYDGRNLFELELEELAAIIERDPWVHRASLRRILPGTLVIQVTERVPSAIALIEGAPHMVDTTGHLVGRVSPQLAGDLPVLTGLDTSNNVTLCTGLVRGVHMLKRLRQASPRFVQSISDMDLSRSDRVLVHTVDPGPRILLDPEQVERNVGRYLELRSDITRQVGTSEYVDLRWQGRIAVKPLQDI